MLDRPRQLVAVEGHPLAGLLHHRQLAQLHALEGREPGATGRTEPAAADRGVVLGRARVLHLGIVVAAERAAHRRRLPSPWCRSAEIRIAREPPALVLDTLPNRPLDLGLALRVAGDRKSTRLNSSH